MLLVIENVLTADEVRAFRKRLDEASWVDGAATGGSLSAAVKRNFQLRERDPVAVELGNAILHRLGVHPLFISAALAERIYPPKFNCYTNGGHYGVHVDSALMRVEDANLTIRSDLSATLFLSDPAEYEGGELTIEGPFGGQAVKLPAGDLVLYPSTSLHRVTPVTNGSRICSFFWIQSVVADEAARTLLFDLDQSIQSLSASRPKADPDIVRLTGVYHNLLRRWAAV